MTDRRQVTGQTLSVRIGQPDSEIIFKALGNPTRLQILEFLGTHAHTISQIASALNIPVSNVKQHIKPLEDAGLINTYLRAASRGTEKVCAGVYDRIICEILPEMQPAHQYSETSMPIGMYSDFSIGRPCGLASQSKIIGLQGDENAFLEPERVDAQLLWFTSGYIEYRFPKKLPPKAIPTGLYLSMEICSEAPNFDENWPSDITIWINDVELGAWTSPGDFGKERGNLNPDWWGAKTTQHGILKTWKVDNEGTFIDGYRLADTTLKRLNIDQIPYFTVRIGIKPDSEYQGGLNLFGRQFGNYPQDIVLRLVYDRDLR